MKDYNLVIDYHPEKAYMVRDTLSRRTSIPLSYNHGEYMLTLLNKRSDCVLVDRKDNEALLERVVVYPMLLEEIESGQVTD